MQLQSAKKASKILNFNEVYLAVFRGFAAITLGILLIFIPDKSFPLLANLMGGFWISSGFVLLHKDADLAKLIGAVDAADTRKFVREDTDFQT